jgi:hypothetical protein
MNTGTKQTGMQAATAIRGATHNHVVNPENIQQYILIILLTS